MKASERLREARARIDTPDKWWAGGMKNPDGECIVMALGMVNEDFCRDSYMALVRCVDPTCQTPREAQDRRLLPTFNDTHSLDGVLDLVDRAIAIAEAEEAEHAYGDPLPDLEPAEMDLATARAAIAAHDAREAGDSRLLTAIREATDTRVDEDREREAA